MIYNVRSCCKDCVDRQVGCHSECERYKEFRKLVEKRNKEIQKDIEARRDQVMFIERFKKEIRKGRRVIR